LADELVGAAVVETVDALDVLDVLDVEVSLSPAPSEQPAKARARIVRLDRRAQERMREACRMTI
jgi:hypothetical protein